MAQQKIVHIVGTGTIGEPLIGILSTFKEQFGIDEVTFHKRTPLVTDRSKVTVSCKQGAKLAVDKDRWQKFVEMGMHPSLEAEEAIERASVIIDCTPVGNENKEKLYNKYASNGRGFIAQGSEDGFGKKYARGINDRALERGKDQFIQVVSCNTHNLAVLIDTIALGPEKEDNLAESRFVCMRRANDLSQEGDFIPAPEAGKHDDPKFGTHQGRDAHYLFKTLGLDLDVYSSALKLNTQYMHTIHFNLKLRRGISKDELMRRLQANLPSCPDQQKVIGVGVFVRARPRHVRQDPQPNGDCDAKPGDARRQGDRRHLLHAPGRQFASQQHRRDAMVYVSGFLRREARAGKALLLQRDLKAHLESFQGSRAARSGSLFYSRPP